MSKRQPPIQDGYNISYFEITKEEFVNFQAVSKSEPQQEILTVNHLRLAEEESQGR